VPLILFSSPVSHTVIRHVGDFFILVRAIYFDFDIGSGFMVTRIDFVF